MRRVSPNGLSATILTGLGIALIVLVLALIYLASRRNSRGTHDEALGTELQSINRSSRPSGPLRIFCGRPSGTPRRCARKPMIEAQKAHAIAAEAERVAGDRRQEILAGAGARGQDAPARRPITATDRIEQDLRARQGGRTGTERRGECRASSSWSPNASANCSESPASRPKRHATCCSSSSKPTRGATRQSRQAARSRSPSDRRGKAQQIIADDLQRSAAEHTIETTVSVVDLPSDDLKGRIIGQGRNIRALETATGVELIVDDTPGAIILSSFDPFRCSAAAGDRAVDRRWPHPSRPNRRGRREGQQMEATSATKVKRPPSSLDCSISIRKCCA